MRRRPSNFVLSMQFITSNVTHFGKAAESKMVGTSCAKFLQTRTVDFILASRMGWKSSRQNRARTAGVHHELGLCWRDAETCKAENQQAAGDHFQVALRREKRTVRRHKFPGRPNAKTGVRAATISNPFFRATTEMMTAKTRRSSRLPMLQMPVPIIDESFPASSFQKKRRESIFPSRISETCDFWFARLRPTI